jgi:uncharacterized protein (DUF2062 family)
MVAQIRSLAERLVSHEQSAHRLALTCALGVFIGISPLIGGHTAMTFLLGWIFGLSIPAVFAVSVFINNPWTMVPIYSLDHLFGKWLLSVFNIDYLSWDPVWVESCNFFLKQHTGISGLSLSAFLFGGNLLAVGVSVMLYPLMKRVFTMYIPKSVGCKRDL